MVDINKSVLFFASILSFSNFLSAAEIIVRFTDGGELAAEVTGPVNFIGSGSCNLSGSVSGNTKITRGNIQAESAASFGTNEVLFADDGTGGSRSLEATASMTLPNLTMNAAGTVTADDNVDLGLVSGSHSLTLDGEGKFTVTENLDGCTSDVNVNGDGGLKVSAAAHKLPTGTVAVTANSRVELGAGVDAGEGDIAASGKWEFESGSTVVLRNGANMHFNPNVA